MEDPSARVLRPNLRATYIAEDGSGGYESPPEVMKAWCRANPCRADRFFRTEVAQSSKPSSTDSVAVRYCNLDGIKKAWMRDFVGGAVTSFTRVVNNAERKFCDYNDYAKFMPIVQSSGAGKSRLIDEYSRSAVGIIFTFRFGEQSGYPPGDVEITDLLRNFARNPSSDHATVIAVLAAAIKLGMCK